MRSEALCASETAPALPCLKSARSKQQGRGSVINLKGVIIAVSVWGGRGSLFFLNMIISLILFTKQPDQHS